MTDEHMGTCIYEKGRFELRKNDHAIIDLKGDFPPIMIASNTVDDGSEPQYADRRGVLHLLNELSDNNPNEEKHWYLKELLDKAWTQYHEQKDENEQLKNQLNKVLTDNTKQKKALNNCMKENKELKQTIQRLQENITELLSVNVEEELLEENEQLKKEIAHLKNRLAYNDQHSNEKFKGIEDWAWGGF